MSFKVRAGTTFGLVGESGSGKSTLARCLLRLEDPTSGFVRFQGHDWLALRGQALRRQRRAWQVVFQDPVGALNPRLPVMYSIAEGLIAHKRITPNQVQERVAGLLEIVGLGPDVMHRFPHEFSGGERQRVTLARALSTDSRLIVLDEALSSLDVSLQAEIINLLLHVQERRGISYLFISHDLAVVERLSDTIGVMHRGRLVECGDASRVLHSPQHEQTRALLASLT